MGSKMSQALTENEIKIKNMQFASPLTDNNFSPLVSIIIWNHKSLADLTIWFKSFRECVFYPNFEIIIVDNILEEVMRNYLKKSEKQFTIKIVCNTNIDSFSKACNQGAAIATGDFLLFLSNDIEVTDFWLDELLKVAQNYQTVGAIGAKLIYSEIPVNTVNEGNGYTIRHAGMAFHCQQFEGKRCIRPYNKGNGDAPFKAHEIIAPVSAVTADCLLMKKTVFEDIGGFDEHYVHGDEDVDLCLKALRKGYVNYYCPNALLFYCKFDTRQADLADKVYFSRRWETFLKRNLLLDKLSQKGLFSESRLNVKVIFPENVPTLYNSDVAFFIKEMERWGANVFILTMGNNTNCYEIDEDTDVVISLIPDYDVSQIKDKNTDCVLIAWIQEKPESWCKNTGFQYYTYVFTKTEIDRETVFSLCKRNAFLCNNSIRQFIEILKVYVSQIDSKIAIMIPVPNRYVAESWGDYHFAVALKKYFERKDFSVEIRFLPEWEEAFDGKYILVLRGLSDYTPKMEHINIMWNISHPDDIKTIEYDMYDINFISSGLWAEHLKKLVRTKVVPLLQCTDTEVFTGEKCGKIAKEEILFVGNTRNVFRDVIQYIIPTKHKLAVYGKGWNQFIDAEYIKGTVIPNKELNYYYSSCDILLNDHWQDMREKGFISNRIFDGLAAGAFIITDTVEGLGDELAACVAMYENKQDLRNKIDFYLEHPELRRQMAIQGQDLVRKQHSFRNRVDTILAFLQSEKNNYNERL